jgi:hypothetical protein
VITGAAVTGDSPDERSFMLRTYCSQWTVTGWRKRPTGIPVGARRRPGATMARFQTAPEPVAVVDPVHDQPGLSTSECGIIASLCGSVYSWMSRSFWTMRGRWRLTRTRT